MAIDATACLIGCLLVPGEGPSSGAQPPCCPLSDLGEGPTGFRSAAPGPLQYEPNLPVRFERAPPFVLPFPLSLCPGSPNGMFVKAMFDDIVKLASSLSRIKILMLPVSRSRFVFRTNSLRSIFLVCISWAPWFQADFEARCVTREPESKKFTLPCARKIRTSVAKIKRCFPLDFNYMIIWQHIGEKFKDVSQNSKDALVFFQSMS